MINRKADFPIFSSHPQLVYLDSAATSQKPKQVIRAVTEWYTKYNSNVHRGIYDLSQTATQKYEDVRQKAADFIGAKIADEIVFTGNASEAINLVAWGWGRKFLKKGDVVVVSEMEHHSNIVPWLRLKEQIGIKIFYLPVNEKYEPEYEKMAEVSKKKIKLVALTQASNVLGTIIPVAEIKSWMQRMGIGAKVLVDAAQSIPHMAVNITDLGCDFLVFSAHKMMAPSGLGVLWAKEEILNIMDPLMVGSHMISKVTKEKALWAEGPSKFETGTGRLEAVSGLGAAIEYIERLSYKVIKKEEEELTKYGLNTLKRVNGLKLYGKNTAENRLGVFSFNLEKIHPHDVGEILNRREICVRTGHHCAQPLMEALGVPATVRASLYIYNTREDIDKLAEGLADVKKVFNHG